VHAARKEDRRLSAALLAAALAHTPEAEEALRGARTRMARKPAALARELLRNFPKGRRGKSRRRRKGTGEAQAQGAEDAAVATAVETDDDRVDELTTDNGKPDTDDESDGDAESDDSGGEDEFEDREPTEATDENAEEAA
jgi:hypothetical protein